MTLPALTIVPAGAGSGKTHRIETQLADWIEVGLVAPERIVAVTFTEAAASDLRQRIRQRLVQRGQWEAALRLDRAYISTIHGFGLRLLSELPFEVGISPRLRKLSEDEERVLVAEALSGSEHVEQVMLSLAEHGYKTTRTGDDWMSGEESFRQHVLELIALFRRIGRESAPDSFVASTTERIDETYGPVADGDVLTGQLRDACRQLLASFPEALPLNMPDLNKSAREHLLRDHRKLVRAVETDDLESDWGLWRGLGDLRLSKRGTPLPEGYDDLAQAVMDAAGRLAEHPGPRDQQTEHARVMLRAAAEGVQAYGAEKREYGLVDFGDMVAQARAMLIGSSSAVSELRRRVDCLVIDEFQDTNPIQFSLLWALHQAGVPALIVGDEKQSIMGFQGADARLFRKLRLSGEGSVEPLTCNWRTNRPLMQFLNDVSAGLFGDEYEALEPRVEHEAPTAPIEVVLATSDKAKQAKVDSRLGVAARIAELLAAGRHQIHDKASGSHRPIRGEDVAVLCRTHTEVGRYAQALRDVGVRTRVDEDGWLASRVVQLTFHALAYVADPADAYAALYLAMSELGSVEPEEALRRMLSDGPAAPAERLGEPLLQRLGAVREGRLDRSVAQIVDETIDALELWDHVAHWSDADQARANLLRLSAESGRFEEADREALAAAGLYGSGLKTFLAWLPARSGEDDKQPQPLVRDEDAVTLTTWHSAKGREWPVVVVATTWTAIAPRLPDTSVEYEGFDDLDDALDRARIAISPKFACTETNERFEEALAPGAVEAARRELYVALTRPREKLILEWPVHVEAKDALTYHTMLRDEAGLELADDKLRVGDHEFECEVHEVCDVPEAESGTHGEMQPRAPGEMRASASGEVPARPAGEMPGRLPRRVGRRALRRRELPTDLTPDAITPSALGEPTDDDATPYVATPHVAAPVHAETTPDLAARLRHDDIGGGLDISLGLAAASRGDFLHRCYEALSGHPERAGLLREIGRSQLGGAVLNEEQQAAVAANVAQFDQWLKAVLLTSAADSSVEHEVPVLALDESGSVVWGYIDVLVETPDGYWIVDHKSDHTDDRRARFEEHYPQLMAYADAVRSARPDKPVRGVAVHWITYGEVTRLEL
ncbi:MAG: UvrD-helicase domain-containing protein [Anaerolineae bacterium]